MVGDRCRAAPHRVREREAQRAPGDLGVPGVSERAEVDAALVGLEVPEGDGTQMSPRFVAPVRTVAEQGHRRVKVGLGHHRGVTVVDHAIEPTQRRCEIAPAAALQLHPREPQVEHGFKRTHRPTHEEAQLVGIPSGRGEVVEGASKASLRVIPASPLHQEVAVVVPVSRGIDEPDQAK